MSNAHGYSCCTIGTLAPYVGPAGPGGGTQDMSRYVAIEVEAIFAADEAFFQPSFSFILSNPRLPSEGRGHRFESFRARQQYQSFDQMAPTAILA